MKINFEATVQVKKSLEYHPITSKYAVFNYKVERKIVDDNGRCVHTFKELNTTNKSIGIATNEEIEAFSHGLNNQITDNYDMILVKQDFIQSLRDVGYVKTMTKFEDVLDETRKNLMSCFDDIEYQLVHNSHQRNMVFDINDNPFPIAITFDYINGNITNEDYDLSKVLHTLVKNDQVKGVDERLKITNIPYYNSSDTRYDSIEFVFMPTEEQMRLIWKTSKQMNPKYPSSNLRGAILRLDLLDINKHMKKD